MKIELTVYCNSCTMMYVVRTDAHDFMLHPDYPPERGEQVVGEMLRHVSLTISGAGWEMSFDEKTRIAATHFGQCVAVRDQEFARAKEEAEKRTEPDASPPKGVPDRG